MGGRAPRVGTRGYGPSPHVRMGVIDQDATHRDHGSANEQEEKIDDEHGDAINI